MQAVKCVHANIHTYIHVIHTCIHTYIQNNERANATTTCYIEMAIDRSWKRSEVDLDIRPSLNARMTVSKLLLPH